LKEKYRRRACGNGGKPSRVFQTAVEIIKKNVAEGYLMRFPRLWRFPQASPSLAFFLFLLLVFFLCGTGSFPQGVASEDRDRFAGLTGLIEIK
jgi:hypothetical protein